MTTRDVTCLTQLRRRFTLPERQQKAPGIGGNRPGGMATTYVGGSDMAQATESIDQRIDRIEDRLDIVIAKLRAYVDDIGDVEAGRALERISAT